MVKAAPKTLSLVVKAIRNLSEIQGCTSREIMNYMTSEYGVAETTVKRQMQAVLKRCLAYGILTCVNGRYSFTKNKETAPVVVGGLTKSCKRKRKVGRCSKRKRNLRRSDGSRKNRKKRQNRNTEEENSSNNHNNHKCYHDINTHSGNTYLNRNFATDASSSGESNF